MCEAGLVRRCCKKLNVSKHSAASIVPAAEEYEHALRYHEAIAMLSQPCWQRCCSCTWRRSRRWLLRPKGHHARAGACAILALWEVLTMVSLMALRCFFRRMQVRKVAIRCSCILPSPSKAAATPRRSGKPQEVGAEDGRPLDQLLKQSQGAIGDGGVAE